jgi:RHS repeat-associated protein
MRYLLQDNSGSPVATQESSCRSRNAQPIPVQSHRQRKTALKIGSSSVAVYDYRNRVYSATLGRFLQTDPIRFEAGDGNLYRYVFNSCLSQVDPSGLYTVKKCNIRIMLGHGKNMPANVENQPCSAASIVACGSSKHSVSTQIPETSPNVGSINLLIASNKALADFEAGKRHASTICADKKKVL